MVFSREIGYLDYFYNGLKMSTVGMVKWQRMDNDCSVELFFHIDDFTGNAVKVFLVGKENKKLFREIEVSHGAANVKYLHLKADNLFEDGGCYEDYSEVYIPLETGWYLSGRYRASANSSQEAKSVEHVRQKGDEVKGGTLYDKKRWEDENLRVEKIGDKEVASNETENPETENSGVDNIAIEMGVKNTEVENQTLDNIVIGDIKAETPDVGNLAIEDIEVENPDVNLAVVNTEVENPDVKNPAVEDIEMENSEEENSEVENIEVENGKEADIEETLRENGRTKRETSSQEMGSPKITNTGMEKATQGEAGRIRELKQEEFGDTKWETLYKILPKRIPFQDDRKFLECMLEDLICLSEKNFRYCKNPFLLYGYRQYGHLLLGRIGQGKTHNYLLGVPGIYHPQEIQAALNYGFESFEGIDKKQPEGQEGRQGYYFARVSL